MSTTFFGARAIFQQADKIGINGEHGRALSLPDTDVLDIAEGTIAFDFRTTTLDGIQGLYSRDAVFMSGDGNHMSIFLVDSTLFARMESDLTTSILRFDGIQAGTDTHVALNFDGSLVKLFVDGRSVDESASSYTQATSPEYTQFGALGWHSATGAEEAGNPSGAAHHSDVLNGEMSNIAIYDAALGDDAIAALASGILEEPELLPEPAPEPAPAPEPEPDPAPVVSAPGYGGHHSGHGGPHSFHRIDAPETPSEIAAFVSSVMSEPEGMMHGHDPGMAMEHMSAMALVPRAEATHVAVAHGSWFDPSTWANGEVPGDDAKVLVPRGIEVTYDGQSDASIFTVRVDGHLEFATDADSMLRLDTMVTSMDGHLTIGTEADPVQDDVRVEILFINSGDIDTNWDPMLLSRGLIAHGKTTMHGAETNSHEKVAVDPMAGDTSLTFSELPTGWEVGDTLVIAGTQFDGYKWDNDIRAVRWHETEDEIRTITSIEETDTSVLVYFEDPLVHDHDTPRDDLKTSVGNYSRDIVFRTENSDEDAPHHNGHIMFMHSDDVDVRYVEFADLGRTDKSERAFDHSDLSNVSADANLKGRYSFHLHRSGTEDIDDPAMVVGNAVFNSPGWGFVHHDSNAILHNNASFDTFGAGFVAESGNEIGAWTDNLAIGAQGVNHLIKNSEDVATFDLARTGDGFWFQGRMVESSGNIAASVNNGFVYMHRGPDMLDFDSNQHDFPELFGGRTDVSPAAAPILDFRDNEVFAAEKGLHVVKANPKQGHDVHSFLSDFTAWEVQTGAHFEYTSHYTLTNFDLIGKAGAPFKNSETGIRFGTNTSDMAIVDAKITGFKDAAIDLHKKSVNPVFEKELHDYHIVGVEFGEGQTPFLNYDPSLDTVLTTAPQAVSPTLTLDGPLSYNGDSVALSGTKTDSLGEVPFPGGSDSIVFSRQEISNILETDGYYTTPQGKNVLVLELLFSDRLTGEIVKQGHFVEIANTVTLGNTKYAGEINHDSQAPETQADNATTTAGTDVHINVLANDTDPEGDALHIDGVVQPHYGGVFHDGDILIYRPDLDFIGTDAFEYWATDGNGNFSKENVIVDIAPKSLGSETDIVSHHSAHENETTQTHLHDDVHKFHISGEDDPFINSGFFDGLLDMHVMANGQALLGVDDAVMELRQASVVAVEGDDAKVGFDGEAGGVSVLRMEAGSELRMIADGGGFSTIEEFRSGAHENDTPDVLSAFDMGEGTLLIDIGAIAGGDAREEVLVDTDEVMGMFEDVEFIGLGANQDATLTVDYDSDKVTVALGAAGQGTGQINVATVGNMLNAAENAEIWDALTEGQGTYEETDQTPTVNDEDLDEEDILAA